jgi:hypothetical protein
MTKDTGGSAFPEVSYKKPDGHGAHIMTVSGGMTLRDYFAGMVLQGICADPSYAPCLEVIVKSSYEIADAMIAERNKP